MEIYIMSSGRAQRQITWRSLPKEIQEKTKIIVPNDEVKDYAAFGEAVYSPEGIHRNLAHARQWLLENVTRHFVMLDDDLTFAVRSQENPTRFLPATDADVCAMFCDMERLLGKFAHVGVAGREGANRQTSQYLHNGRVMRILAFDAEVLRSIGARFDRMQFMIDFDMTLQLLRKSFASTIINYMVQNQSGSNAVGGCSQYRTQENQASDARILAELHPHFVKVVTKKTKTAWGWGEREDVVIQWKKAYESGCK